MVLVIEEILASKTLRAKHLHILVFEHNSILYRCSMQALYRALILTLYTLM